MRVTDGILYQNFLTNVQHLNQDSYRYNEQVTTGRAVNRPSDDPVRFNMIAAIRTEIANLNQFAENTDNVNRRLEASDARLNDTGNSLIRIITLVEQAASSSNAGDSRKAIAKDLEAITQEMLSLADSSVGGRRLFGGTRNTTDSLRAVTNNPGAKVYSASTMVESSGTISVNVPDSRFLAEKIYQLNILDAAGNYELINLDANNSVVTTGTFAATGDSFNIDGMNIVYDGAIPSTPESILITPQYAYNGTEDDIRMQIDDSTFITQNVQGPYVFGGTEPNLGTQVPGGTLFDDLVDLRRALLEDDSNGVIGHIDTVRAHYDEVTRIRANVGGRISNMRSFLQRSEAELAQLNIESTKLESINLAEAITNLTRTETGLAAALNAGSRLGQLSLFNYLR